ncbi:MAG: hypothetical protein APF76_06500 [Desulfitibacter sp. BRH_c19]|nr:MAG: hypothetical protein APF76_06500 [Desulfitibacter sp. BRH_c19]
MKLAIFDFDGTLFPFETFPYLYSQWKEQKKSHLKYINGMLSFMPVYLLYKAKLVSSEKMRRKAVFALASLFNGMDMKQVDAFFNEAYANMKKRIDSKMVKEIKKCQEEGFHLVLLSGALKPILDRVAEEYNFNDVIGTELTMRGNTPFFYKNFQYIQGEEKAITVVKKYRDYEVDWKNSRAYADSFSDLAIMELAGEPVAVRPDKILLEVAKERKWKIIS